MAPMQTSEMSAEFQALKSDLQMLKRDLQTLATTAVNKGVQKAGDARETVQSKVESSFAAMEDFVQQRPMTTLGLAFGAGLIAGVMLRRN